ncbi:MAG TPA: hypothetical protein VKB65_11315 [Myxococcota bacterium]|nr:hypothetical protein [Myxococcota bacterium]
MALCVTEEAGPAAARALDALLPEEPHLEYANFRPVAARPGAAVALHRERWLAGDAVALLVARDGDAPVAALRLAERPFETAHFELPMASLSLPVAPPEPAARAAALGPLYAAALERLRGAGFRHVAARVSTRDREGAWAAQDAGARWVDTQVSWMCPLSGVPHDEALPGRLRIESHGRESVGALPEASWRRLADWGGEAFDRGPLVFDRTLPAERARAIYREWTARVMGGEWADAVVVALDGDEVVAFISMLELPEVSRAAGEKVCGRGLGATLPEYRGLFTAIQREMIARRPLGAAWMENETQSATIGSINVYAKLGFRYLRSTCTFHARLDGASPCA